LPKPLASMNLKKPIVLRKMEEQSGKWFFQYNNQLYPVTDHYSSGHSSWQENKEGYILSADMMKWFWDNFITDPTKFDEASPLRTKNLEGLAPAFIATANYDPLRDEGKAYAEKLEASGVEVVYENYENVHGFYGTGKMGQALMNKSVAFLIQKFKE
jgi:acetyl esterase